MTTEQVKNEPQAFKVKGDWSIQAEKLKAKYPTLTDDDLKFETGKEADLVAKIGKRLNKSQEETNELLETAKHPKL